jgi:hypothetical protein
LKPHPILRFPAAVKREPAIDSWMNGQPEELRSIVRPWFERMRACGADVREPMHDGCPTACVEDAAFGYVNTFRAHANVGFFHGVALQDPLGLLEGTGRFGRHVKLRPGAPLDSRALEALIGAAYLDITARLRFEAGAQPKGIQLKGQR